MACILEARRDTKAERKDRAQERCVTSTDAGAMTGVTRVLSLVVVGVVVALAANWVGGLEGDGIAMM